MTNESRGYTVPAASGTYRRRPVNPDSVPTSTAMGRDRREFGVQRQYFYGYERVRPSLRHGVAGYNAARR